MTEHKKKRLLCRLGLHKWVVYNLGWRRLCVRCHRVQVCVGRGLSGKMWGDTTLANLPAHDTDIRVG